MTTYYDLLGVTPEATVAEIRAAYRRAARQRHPDTRAADGTEDPATRAEDGVPDMVAVNEAWSVLGDPARRAAYDANLHPARRETETRPARGPGEADVAAEAAAAENVFDDWRLDVPITDGRAVRTLGMMVAITAALAVAAVVALFAYAIFWAG